MGQYSRRNVLRQFSQPLLQRYLQTLGINGALAQGVRTTNSFGPVEEALDAVPGGRVDAEIQAVHELATEGGSTLLIEESHHWEKPWASGLATMANDHERAMYCFLEDPEFFRITAGLAEMDRLSESRWTTWPVAAGRTPATDQAALDGLSQSLKGILKNQGRGRNCHVEAFTRRNPDRVCYFAYPEDHPKTDLGYSEKNTFGRQTRRVAMELVFVYCPVRGTLEAVVSGDKGQKAKIGATFCQHILGLNDLPEPNRRAYDLSALKDRKFVFTTDSVDNIERVLVRQLRFDLPGRGGRRIAVSALPAADDRFILYDLINDALNQTNVPLPTLTISQARLSVAFRGQNGAKGKTVTFDITAPDSCNLKDHGHDLIVKKYLKRWKLAP